MQTKHQDKLPALWLMVSNMVPPVGFFLYFKYKKHYPVKAKGALVNALIGIPIAAGGGYLVKTFLLA